MNTQTDHLETDINFDNLKPLDWLEVLSHLSGYASSSQGQKLLLNLKPLETSNQAEESFLKIEHAIEILKMTEARPEAWSLDFFGIFFSKLEKKSTLKFAEFKSLRAFIHELRALEEILIKTKTPWSQSLIENIMPTKNPLKKLEQTFMPDGAIRSDASSSLFHLFEEKKQCEQKIKKTLDQIVKDHNMEPYLQDKFVTTREGRWVIPVKSGQQHSVDGIIHAHSQSKQTVFIEPEQIIHTNNRLREVESEIEREVEKILKALSAFFYDLRQDLNLSKEALLEADMVFAKAQFSLKLRAHPPRITEKEILLENLKHPLLLFSTVKAVGNTLDLDQKRRVFILSGPNNGGKTILLKSFGLAAQMSRCGLWIPTSAPAKIPFFKNIHIIMGDNQNIDSHQSTFAGHLLKLSRAGESEGLDTLILVDEICAATDPEEGSALAGAFVDHYIEQKCFAMISSHLSPVKKGWLNHPCVIHGSFSYTENSGPNYQLHLNAPGFSRAFETAQSIGVSEKILRNAQTYLSSEAKHLKTQSQKLSKMEEELQIWIEKNKVAEKKAVQKQNFYEKKLEDFEATKQEKIKQAVEAAKVHVEEMINKAQVSNRFKRFSEYQKIKKELPHIVKDSQASTPKSAEDFTKAYPPGRPVFIQSLKKHGIIQGNPNAKGQVPILSESMQIWIHWQDLSPDKNPNPPSLGKVLKPSFQSLKSTRQTEAKSLGQIDVRGMKSDEAWECIEKNFDQCMLEQCLRVKIVHGHGTETLKRSIRKQLSQSPYVKKWEAGNHSGNGDGVTWVELAH